MDFKDDFKDVLYKEFYNFIKAKVEGQDPDYYGKDIHVSSLYGCLRANVMSQFPDKFKTRDKTLGEYLQMYIGTLAHTMLEDFAKCVSERIEFVFSEKDISKYLPKGIAGRMDMLVKDKKTGKYYIVDLKTMRPNAFKYGNLVKDNYIAQTNTYKHGLVNMASKYQDADILLIAMDRSGTNDMQILDVPLIETKEIENLIEQNLRALKLYEQVGELPDPVLPIVNVDGKRLPTKLTWQCDYCKFYKISCEGKDKIKCLM